MKSSRLKTFFLIVLSFVLVGLMIPEQKTIPVSGATSHDWNQNTFWYEPWGASGVHKGIDIFAKPDTPVVAATNLVILHHGKIKRGGNIIVALGPKWLRQDHFKLNFC